MSDLRLVHALCLSIPSTQLLEKFGDKLQPAPGVRRQPPVNRGGIPVEPRDNQDVIRNAPAAAGGARQQ